MVPEYLFILLAALWAASGAVIPLSIDITVSYLCPQVTSRCPTSVFHARICYPTDCKKAKPSNRESPHVGMTQV